MVCRAPRLCARRMPGARPQGALARGCRNPARQSQALFRFGILPQSELPAALPRTHAQVDRSSAGGELMEYYLFPFAGIFAMGALATLAFYFIVFVLPFVLIIRKAGYSP